MSILRYLGPLVAGMVFAALAIVVGTAVMLEIVRIIWG